MKVLTAIVAFSLFLLFFVEFFHPIRAMTQDLGRHLLSGKIIVRTLNVPKVNLYSYTYPNFPFINHHWFSEVVFYLLQKAFGFNGLQILSFTTILLAFGGIFYYCSKRYNFIALVFVSLLLSKILIERTDIRPEIFSFLFLSVFVVILYKNRELFTKWIFILPFLELLWVNMHIYFPVGLAVTGLFVVDNILTRFWSRRSTSPQNDVILANGVRPESLSNLLFILLLCSITTLFNPNSIQGALYPLHVFQNYGYQIEENQNVFFLWSYFGGKTTILFFFISASILFLTLLLTIKKARLIDYLFAFFFGALAITSERNLPLFVFGAFIPFVHNLSAIFKKISIFNNPRGKTFLSIVILIFILWDIIYTIKIQGIGFGMEQGAKNGVDFMIQNNIHGPIFNNFDIGSYLEYRLFPKEKVFVDGRPEAYPTSFFQNIYIPMQINTDKFKEYTSKYKINTIFYSITDQTPWADGFFKQIFQNNNWKIVYLDDYVIIFVKDTKENQKLIQKYGMTADNLKISNLNEKDLQALFRLENFFIKNNWISGQIPIYQKILNIEPSSCFANYNMYAILSQRNDPSSGIYLQKYQQYCQ